MSIQVSEELFAQVSPGVELCYQTFGSPGGDPLVLVMGLGGPMTWWDPELCTMLAEAGFHVVRFDNRDTGKSSRVEGRVSRKDLVKSFLGRSGRPPYTLSDMAADAFGLMDHLGWDSAHLVGVSMGGDDRADDGDLRTDPGPVADQHHVDDRKADGRLAAPQPAAEPDRQARRP